MLKSEAKMKDFDYKDPAESAWKLFEKTGEISYYLLYKNLKKK